MTHTQHKEHALSKGSGEIPLQEFYFANLRLNLVIILTEPH